jgi:hypothetical protein
MRHVYELGHVTETASLLRKTHVCVSVCGASQRFKSLALLSARLELAYVSMRQHTSASALLSARLESRVRLWTSLIYGRVDNMSC